MNITSAIPISSMQTFVPPAPSQGLDSAKLDKACGQFEGMLVRQILQEGLKPLLATPLGSSGAGSDVYEYFVTDALANSVSGKRGIGISSMLQAQLTPLVQRHTSNEQK
jgi:Rod binding domain-containing protein